MAISSKPLEKEIQLYFTENSGLPTLPTLPHVAAIPITKRLEQSR